MKHRSLSAILCAIMMSSLLLTACGKTAETPATPVETTESVVEETPKAEEEPKKEVSTDATGFSINLDGVTTTDELEARIKEHLAGCIESLKSRGEDLRTEIDSYDKYCDQKEKVSEFYATVEEETNLMCIMLREYAAAYGRMILDSDMSNEDKYKAVDGINDCIYDDACDEINDEIYDRLMDDMNDHFYDGILKDGEDSAEYSEWYDVCSKEYSQWYDTSSEVYSLYYDAASDIYSFYYDMSSELYSGDLERAEKVYTKFLEKIDKKKNKGNNVDAGTNATFDTTLRSASSPKELEEVVDAHVSECVQALKQEWADFSSKVDTYDKYRDSIDDVEKFHDHIVESSEQILQMISHYGVSYANLIMESDSSSKDKYKDMEDLKDCIYDDACDYVKEDIYEDLLGEIKDYYYEGILSDAKDSIDYSEWSDARGDAYDWWSDARSDIYDAWSDTRSDIYSFCSDVRSELYSGDTEKANKEIEKFAKKIGSSVEKADDTKTDDTNAEKNKDSDKEKDSKDSSSSSDIRPEFKAAMDDYEEFYDEYCDFMKKYKENPTDLKLAKEYIDMVAKLEEMQESFDKWEDNDLNDAELKYYIDVTARIEKKLIDVM